MIDVTGRDIEIDRGFVDDLANHNIKKSLNRLNKPLLILHSPEDEMVGIDHATEI